MGLLGGYIFSSSYLGYSYVQFLSRMQEAADMRQFYIGLSKAPVFAVLIGIVSQHDVGMGKLGNGGDLPVKAANSAWARELFSAEQLDGHDPFQQPVAGLEDLAHGPFAQALEQHVLAQDEMPPPAA